MTRKLIEFDTDRIAEWDAIADRWATAIGAQRTARWSVLGADRDRSGRHVAVVEFPGYAAAMTNSAIPPPRHSSRNCKPSAPASRSSAT